MSIEFKGLVKRFGNRTVLRGVDLVVPPGEVLYVVGPSGTGKSVLMKHAIGLLTPDEGEVHVDGMRVDTMDEKERFTVRRRCGYVFQHPALFDTLSVGENVAMPLVRQGRLRHAEAKARARRWLARVGIDAFDAHPDDLGSGERKRVAIARTLALEPRHVIYDEPTTGLDPVNARRVDALIRSLADQTGVTSIVVSHDLESVFAVADRVAFLYEGRVRAVLPVDQFREGEDPLLRRFVTAGTGGHAP